MYSVSEQFLEAAANGEIQHIRGEITPLSGAVIPLDGSTLSGSPRYERQCTSSREEFSLGALYTGTVELSLNLPELHRESLRGAKIRLEYTVGTLDEWIPLGVWTVTDPQRDSSGMLTVRGSDCTASLDVPITAPDVGVVTIEKRLKMVTSLTGVEFAQTVEELCEIYGNRLLNRWGSTFCATCRAEVSALAQLLGGFAIADREGRIEFRKFAETPVMDIPARLRHSAELSEYSFGLRGISYTDQWGVSATKIWTKTTSVNTECIPVIQSSNPYIWDTADNPQRQYLNQLEMTAGMLEKLPDWTPGEIGFYGNPALDIGDLVTVSGGVNGSSPTLFLITADLWQFRGKQVLISAGASQNGTYTAAGNSSPAAAITTMNITKTLSCIELEAAGNTLTGDLQEVASGGFSVRSETLVTVRITAVLRGISAAVNELHILLDGVMQTVFSADTVRENEVRTVHFSAPLTVPQGSHSVTAEGRGRSEIIRISATVTGQDITPVLPDTTTAGDYLWHIENSAATVDRYTGTALRPSIPAALGGTPVKVIGGGSFTDSEIEYAFIPEGAEVIE